MALAKHEATDAKDELGDALVEPAAALVKKWLAPARRR